MTRFLACFTATLLLAAAVLADGHFVEREPRALAEPTQKAVIVHRNGVEDLILQVRYAGASEDFAWIVPTPTRPYPHECSKSVFQDLYSYVIRHAPARRRGQGGGSGGNAAFGG